MNLLAIDTAANFCSACVLNTEAGFELGRIVRDIGKGHAELLLGVIEETLRISKIGYADLGGIAVATGPGSFTGVRVGVSDSARTGAGAENPGSRCHDAGSHRRGDAFGLSGAVDHGRNRCPAGRMLCRRSMTRSVWSFTLPSVIGLDEAIALAAKLRPVLAGSAAGLIADAVQPLDLDVGSTLRHGRHWRLRQARSCEELEGEKPKPVYLREPDAKPQAGLILPRSGS